MKMERFELNRKIKIDGLEFTETTIAHGKTIDEKDSKELYMFMSVLLGKTKYNNYSLEKILKTYEKSYIIVLENEREKSKEYLTLAELIEAIRGCWDDLWVQN